MPFAFFMTVRSELDSLATSSGAVMDDVSVDLSGTVFEDVSGGGGMVTLIDFQAIKDSDFFQNHVYASINLFIKYFLWIWMAIYVWRRFIPPSDAGESASSGRV